MSATPETPNGDARPPAQPPRANEAQLQAECERLSRLLGELQRKFDKQEQRLAMIQEERDQLRAIVYPTLWQQFSEEELRRFAEDDSTEGTMELHEFLGEIEDIVNGDKQP